MADIDVVRLPAVGVVGARTEVDGLVAGPTGDVVVRAVNRHGVRPASELDVVVGPGPDRNRVVSVAHDHFAVGAVAHGDGVGTVAEGDVVS